MNASRSMKRSASVASLPTPPRTVNSRKRHAPSRPQSRTSNRSVHSHHSSSSEDTDGGEKHAEDDDDDDGGMHIVPHPGRVLFAPRKKQRTDRLDAVVGALAGADRENPFWDGQQQSMDLEEDDADKTVHPVPRTRSSSPEVEEDRVKHRSHAPVSPPPSRRQSKKQRRAPPSEPATPPPEPSTAPSGAPRPVRDSPANPFLDESPASGSGDAEPRTPPPPRAPTEDAEKPTISYVFRGMRATFANPLYNRSPSERARSLLPLEHPDYEPDPACPPRDLFGARKRRQRTNAKPVRDGKRKGSVGGGGTNSEWDSSESEGEGVAPAFSPPKRLFQA
ncbi:hypothetical protein BD410DRAFT_827086 [Rickenella mellea]|uniref:Uncharacterized protein n=1 Tax=Rickenella mellea TaxID=50990 RepID=A0A4Y7QBF9_9AGAM|nr:hypothetical protein BD410DRAFT_827086 [Rickenella mellea]